MKVSFWDVLSILGLLAICMLAVLFTSIFVAPNSMLNPFPPEPLPAQVIIPSSTPTLLRLPPTWTATLGSAHQTPTLAPSQTMQPSATGFRLPTFTHTPTNTYTPSNTPTITLTFTLTKSRTPTATVPSNTPETPEEDPIEP